MARRDWAPSKEDHGNSLTVMGRHARAILDELAIDALDDELEGRG